MNEGSSASHRPEIVELPEEARALATRRFHLLRPFLEDGVPLTRIAEANRLKLRTVQSWVAQYRRQGLAGFLHQGRADRGCRRRIPPDLQHLVEGLALCKPVPTAAFVHRQVAKVAEQQGWPVPTYGT
ncbi:MAG: helix-turn-helix domain-containing protein, partial [Actinobacteria bacterium]|nr:helix-turn-helix domain-containing protein [Actinomycetota bacterium]